VKTGTTYRSFALGLAGCVGVALIAWTPAYGLTISGPLGSSSLQELNSTTPPPADYGPPPPASFFEPGPLTTSSGGTSILYAGPKPGQVGVESLLFVLSSSVLPQDMVSFVLKVNGVSVMAEFSSSDFFSTVDCGFGTIEGIANGEVNGIVFPDAYHAAARVWLNLGLDAGTPIGSVEIVTPTDLRVDIFGVGLLPAPTPSPSGAFSNKKRGPAPVSYPTAYIPRIINNTPNSGAVGYRVPDGGLTVLLLGGSIMVLGLLRKARL
jgi:hypothetical protein